MFWQPWDEVSRHCDPFLLGNTSTFQPMFAPPPTALAIPGNELESLSGELGYSSSGCSSCADSPGSNGTSHGAHSSIMCPVREAFNNRDFQGVRHNQWTNSIIDSMNRATPYSPEEKKERIERYRSKRNLRNFNKKIKYECRKTLADSRPRVRGRFARNYKIEKAPRSQWDHRYVVEDDGGDNDYYWINIFDVLSANMMP